MRRSNSVCDSSMDCSMISNFTRARRPTANGQTHPVTGPGILRHRHPRLRTQARHHHSYAGDRSLDASILQPAFRRPGFIPKTANPGSWHGDASIPASASLDQVSQTTNNANDHEKEQIEYEKT